METTPSIVENANSATATLVVRVNESGEIWNREKEIWVEMTPSEFEEWRGGGQDTHKATATLEKSIDDRNGAITIIRQEMVGNGAARVAPAYNETSKGINITLHWSGDCLDVKWAAADTKDEVEQIVVPFSKRFQSPVTDAKNPARRSDNPSH